jgi:uncharacterized membrane protein YeaQ/YmgE (transglycosylase-associated protein family)
MGGLGVFVWLAIGSAAGWIISRLMVGAEDDALRGTAAGMVGGILGGLGMRLLESSPALGPNDLNTSLAALAGSLWLTWITCVVTSGRRRDSATAPPEVRFAPRVAAPVAAPEADGARPTLTYSAARDQLVEQLLRDAMAHEAERYHEVGQRFDIVECALPRGATPELAKLRVAVAFWDGWIDARNRGWRPDRGIGKTEWPLLARTVAADLEGDRDVTDARVVTRFDVGRHPSLGNRVQTLAARMHATI